MRFLSCVAAASLLFISSCRTMNLPDTRDASEPYVQLKNGKKYTGTSAERSSGVFVKDKIILGDTSFKTKDVAFYSTGGATFANVHRKTFAHQVAAGKINLYKYTVIRTSSNASGGTTSSKHTYYFVQKAAGDPVKPLSYKTLKPLVKHRTPEFEMFEKYRKTRIVSTSLGLGTVGLVGAGIALIGTAAGPALIGAGIATFIGYSFVRATNSVRMLKTIVIADKSDVKPKHERVK